MVIINLYNIAAHPAPKNGPTQYNQCSVQMLDMTAVPNDLAGFIEAPDTGMPRMDNVICINPIANGAISRIYPRVSRAKHKNHKESNEQKNQKN